MHSEAYITARKEFINCIVLSPIGLFVPLALAFREWKPIMDEELRKERENGRA
jgi:hypothetical protein